METATCTLCNEARPLEDFPARKAKRNGRASRCRECEREYRRQWERDNKEHRKASREPHAMKAKRQREAWRQRNLTRYREKQAAYAESRPEVQTAARNGYRARQAGVEGRTLTPEECATILTAFGHRCAYCGADGRVTIDHAVPLSRGGPDDLANVLPACKPCNGSKHRRTPLEWFLSDAPRVKRVMAHFAAHKRSA